MPKPPTPSTPPDSDPDIFDADAGRLLAAAERIMQAIAKDPAVDLSRPEDLLALQLLGPCLSRALGMDDVSLKASVLNTLEIAKLIEVGPLRLLLQQRGMGQA